MKKTLKIAFLFLSIQLGFTGCGGEKTSFTKDADGYYNSNISNFKIKFPVQPSTKVIDNQVGLEKFKIYFYQAVKEKDELYNLEYIELPTALAASSKQQNYLELVLTNLSNIYRRKGFNLTSKKEITYQNTKGLEFRYDGVMGSVIGRFFNINDKTYTMTFMGHPRTSEINAYFDSFQIVE